MFNQEVSMGFLSGKHTQDSTSQNYKDDSKRGGKVEGWKEQGKLMEKEKQFLEMGK